jgi:hypothetical protein
MAKDNYMEYAIFPRRAGARYQSGVITTFTGVLILVLLTLMMFFAVRVGVFEQRVSSNEMRQKQAFHAAESGIQHAKEYLKQNAVILASPITDMLSDDTDGWLAAGNERWLPCSGAGLDLTGSGSHPCYAEPNVSLRPNLFYWSCDSNAPPGEGPPCDPGNPINVPVATGSLVGATETVEVRALLCLLVIDVDANPPVQGCSTDTTVVDGSRYMVTLLARGQADCENGANCGAEAILREQVSNFGGAAGGQAPAVPLTTKNMFPPTGAAEVVANPNGGGVGVPISVWMNKNGLCATDGAAIDPSQGSWATCEAHEWYETESIPEDVRCPGSCSCAFQESLSYTHGTEDTLGIDLVQDENFPCDLFQFYFGTPRENYESVKAFAKVLSDCDSLGPGSSGIYWISGSACNIQSNTVIGSAYAPVLLISAAGVTSMQGGATIFGVLYVSDVENSAAIFQSRGNNIVYGQVVLDAAFGSYNGTFQVVYNENLIARVSGTGGLGNVPGGWADFHPADWPTWQ